MARAPYNTGTMSNMFHLETADNGVTYLVCSALQAPHGFSTRQGGESEGAFAALNLGVSAGDDEATVRRNRSRWAEALGFEAPIVSLHQIHGGVVHAVDQRPGEALKGDAVVTATESLPISVFTADCTPILLHDPVTGAVGAVHAGWRGTVAQVAGAAVAAMATHYGARPADICAAIGPAIGPCCFEVGDEVAAAIADCAWPGWERAIVSGHAKPHVDLFTANQDQLVNAGLLPANVHNSGMCTFCEADKFYSWRRDHGVTGRLQAAIARPRNGAA